MVSSSHDGRILAAFSLPRFPSEIAAHYGEGIEQPRLDCCIEREPSTLGVSAHLLALARRPIA